MERFEYIKCYRDYMDDETHEIITRERFEEIYDSHGYSGDIAFL